MWIACFLHIIGPAHIFVLILQEIHSVHAISYLNVKQQTLVYYYLNSILLIYFLGLSLSLSHPVDAQF